MKHSLILFFAILVLAWNVDGQTKDLNGNLNVAGSLSAATVTDSGLTPGNCLQAGAGGLLTTASLPCDSTYILPLNNTFTGTNAFNLGITGTGNIGTLTLGTGALGANAWTGVQNFGLGITGTGNIGALTLGTGALGMGNTWTAPQVFNGLDSTVIGRVYYISRFAGGDLGAKSLAAVAACLAVPYTNCKYIIDTSGTISTSPNFPGGSIVEYTGTGPLTLATTWDMEHGGVVYNFNGATILYNQDSGASAFFIGKGNSGTVTCNGTGTITWASGSDFSNLDVGDGIYINHSVFSAVVTGITSSTQISVSSAACPAGTYTYGAGLNAAIPASTILNSGNSVTIKDLVLKYTGAGTTTNTGIQIQFAKNYLLDNVTVANFAGTNSYALLLQGAILGDFRGFKSLYSSRIKLDAYTIAGTVVTSNSNHFPRLNVGQSPANSSGITFYIANGSSNNELGPLADFEGNANRYTVYVDSTSSNNLVGPIDDFEVNGDNSTSAIDVRFVGGVNNRVEQTSFSTGPVLTDDAMSCENTGTSCVFDYNYVGAGTTYLAAYGFINGAASSTNSIAFANITSGLPTVEPLTTLQPSGNFSTAGTVVPKNGTNVIYRCSVAGTLRAGQLTSVSGDCGTAVDTGLRTP